MNLTVDQPARWQERRCGPLGITSGRPVKSPPLMHITKMGVHVVEPKIRGKGNPQVMIGPLTHSAATRRRGGAAVKRACQMATSHGR